MTAIMPLPLALGGLSPVSCGIWVVQFQRAADEMFPLLVRLMTALIIDPLLSSRGSIKDSE